ncbi:uncharacterized protein K02A2.6-like [Achroia grisella]|uniref:uncharacterized protein K02A2.6-like n=1 Tax=Achroia grisella TaxID=688607 RepID=UPI0027D2E6BE|nr:uncharacterized protein K02A2.6-like [Achroia grisella]
MALGWGERQLRRVRAELASERVLAHFDPEARLVLTVDAGPTGLGAYISSEKNVVADYFSRAPVSDVVCKSDKEFDAYSAINFLDATSSAVLYNDVEQATKNDKTLQTVIKYMNVGWRKIKCKSITPYFLCRTDLQFENGVLLRGHKVVIPLLLRERMLQELHSTHLGIVKMKCNARGRMWWPGIDSDIEHWSGACEQCMSVRPSPPRAPPAPWPRPPAPWCRIHIDYLFIGQRVSLVVIDAFSKWLECIHMNAGVSTQALIIKLKQIFSVFGIPNTLVSDNDVKINCKEFKDFCSSNGIEYITSPIYHPCSNGQVENSVRTCKKMLKIILKENLNHCYLKEKLYLFEYRNTIHCSTGQSPAKLMFGRNLRSRLDLILPKVRKTSDNNNDVVETNCRHFKKGDRVLVRWYSARKEHWKVGVVEEIIGNRLFKIYIHDINTKCIRHLDQILQYKGKINMDCKKKPENSTARSVYGYGASSFSPPLTVSQTQQLVDPKPSVVMRGENIEVLPSNEENRVLCDDSDCRVTERVDEDSTQQESAAQIPHATSTFQPVSMQSSPGRSKRPRKKVDYTVYFK